MTSDLSAGDLAARELALHIELELIMVTTTTVPRETIKVRRMDLDFPESMPTFWFDDNPLLTATLAALAVAFPAGERYFISSVRHFLSQVDDPELREQVMAFIGQEANHTKEHLAFNAFLDSRGWPATRLANWVEDRVAELKKISSPEESLARTAALEHFTAILAGAFLEHPELTGRMSPEAAKLWVWHAIEEVEHRAVAFDVYKATVDDEALRRRMMASVTLIFIAMNVGRTAVLLKASGRFWEPKSALKGLYVLWGRPGFFRKVIPQYLAYYREDFHPSQIEHGAYLEAAKRRYLGAQA